MNVSNEESQEQPISPQSRAAQWETMGGEASNIHQWAGVPIQSLPDELKQPCARAFEVSAFPGRVMKS
jgi:hypothetical protein